MESSTKPIPHRTSHNLKKELYIKEMEDKLSKRRLPTSCKKGEKLLRTIILKAALLHIPSGRHHLGREPVPANIQELMKARDDLCSQDPTSPRLHQMNDELTRETWKHKQQSWRQYVETLDHKSDPTKLWKTLKAISSAENEAISFNGHQISSPKDIANRFNQQFTTSKLRIHKSSRHTRKTVRATKRKMQLNSPRKRSRRRSRDTATVRHLARTSYPSFTSSTSDPKKLNS